MKLLKNYLLFGIVLLGVSVFVQSCSKNSDTPVTPSTTSKSVADYDYKVVYDWNELFLEIERYAAGYRPGPAPRALAYMGLSAYEACVSGMPQYNSLANLYPGLTMPQPENKEYHWPTVINASYANLMRDFFPAATDNLKNEITALQSFYNDKGKGEVDGEVYLRSKKFGETVASLIWAYAESDDIGKDHYLNPFEDYDWEAAYKKEGDWRPTFPGPGKPMGGVWSKARRFVIGDADMICRAPLGYSASSNSSLYSQALEVYAQNTPTLSYEAEWVGEFWSDDLLGLTFSPGPRWLAIGNQVLVAEKSTLETALVMSAKMGLALNDASIGCWNSKYYYNVERPQTYINRVIDPSWKPALYNPITGDEGVTPSFPAYPSGHSTMGAAGAEVLGAVFGYAYGMADHCHENRVEFEGKPRSFGSFFEMAQENAWSRVPLGVHFRMDCEEGVRYGSVIGRKVNDMPWKK